MQSTTRREQVYRIYLDFLETAENKRHWSVSHDLPWDHLDAGKATDKIGQCVELFCAEELYVPDYSSKGMELSRSMFGTAWFQIRWAFEESQHGLAFRQYLTRSGLRSEEHLEALQAIVYARSWELPFHTSRQMACYGALQEGATFTAYNQQRSLARTAGDTLLESIFFHIGRDEAAHAGFYRAIIQIDLRHNRAETIADLAYVLSNFRMPGDGLIPDYRQRLNSSGAGITPRAFLERVLWPLLSTLEISREEMKLALKQYAAAA
jgi:acyl-[acyl-carrier-protein] desaturase